MKKIMIFAFIVISLVFLMGCAPQATTQKEYICSNGQVVLNPAGCPTGQETYQEEAEINSPNVCSDECYYSGRDCTGNSIYECGDFNGDGCDEERFIRSCGPEQQCQNGNCVEVKKHDLRVVNAYCTKTFGLSGCYARCYGDIVNYGDFIEASYHVKISTQPSWIANMEWENPPTVGIGQSEEFIQELDYDCSFKDKINDFDFSIVR